MNHGGKIGGLTESTPVGVEHIAAAGRTPFLFHDLTGLEWRYGVLTDGAHGNCEFLVDVRRVHEKEACWFWSPTLIGLVFSPWVMRRVGYRQYRNITRAVEPRNILAVHRPARWGELCHLCSLVWWFSVIFVFPPPNRSSFVRNSGFLCERDGNSLEKSDIAVLSLGFA